MVFVLIVVCCLFSIFFDYKSYWIPIDADAWVAFSAELAKKLSDPSYEMILNVENFNHSFTPLFPLIGALFGQIFEITISLSIESILFSLGSIWLVDRILKEHYDYSGSERSLILLLFIPNQMMLIYFAVPTYTTQIILFFTLSNLYTWQKYSKSSSLKNAVLVSLSYSLTLFSREILWPMLAFPVLSFLLNLLLKWKTETVFTKKNIEEFLKIVGLSLAIPALVYIPFFLYFEGYSSMNSAWTLLITFKKYLPEFLFSCLLAFGFIWIFILFRLKPILHDSRNQMLILWTTYFFGYRLIAPGPFWGFYWIPIMPIIMMFSHFALRDLTIKIHQVQLKLVYAVIIGNIIFQVTLFQYIFNNYIAPW